MMCVVLLFTHQEVKPMDYCLENKIAITTIVLGVLFVGYQYCSVFNWLQSLWGNSYGKLDNKIPMTEPNLDKEEIEDELNLVTMRISLMGKGINHIAVKGSGLLLISQTKKGEEEYISVTADKKSVDALRLNTEDDYCFYLNCDCKQSTYRIALRNIARIALEDCIEAKFATPIRSQMLQIELADNAKMISTDNHIEVMTLKVIGSGDSKVALAGIAPLQNLCFSDNATYDALKIKSNDACIEGHNSSCIMLRLENHDNGKRRLQSALCGKLFDNSTVQYVGIPGMRQLICNDASKTERIT